MDSLTAYNGRISQILRVASPALLSLALCPATLYLYTPFVTTFWPPQDFMVPPDVNEVRWNLRSPWIVYPIPCVFCPLTGRFHLDAICERHRLCTLYDVSFVPYWKISSRYDLRAPWIVYPIRCVFCPPTGRLHPSYEFERDMTQTCSIAYVRCLESTNVSEAIIDWYVLLAILTQFLIHYTND